MGIMFDTVPPPPARVRVPMDPELKEIKPMESRLVDRRTASALQSWMFYRGWASRRRKEGEMIRVWRLS